MNNKITRLTYIKNISEKENSILYLIKSLKKILLYAPMKGGKTYLVINRIAKALNKLGIRVILISPVTLLIDQQGERAKLAGLDNWTTYYSKHKGLLTTTNIIVTPDSLPKVEESLIESKDKFVILTDESHERESSVAFRKAFKNIRTVENNPNCLCSVDMTATPQNLVRSSLQEYDRYIQLVQSQTLENGEINPHIFKHGKKFTLRVVEDNKIETVIAIIEEVRRKNQGTKIRIKLDSKVKLDKLEKYFKERNIKFEYLSSGYKKDELEDLNRQKESEMQEIRNNIKEYKEIEADIVGFTALINSGIEINNSPNTIFINFTNDTYNFINEIQSVGRFRNGLKEFILVVPKEEEEQDTPKERTTYEKEYQKLLSSYKAGIGALKELIKNKNNVLTVENFLSIYKALEIREDNEIIINEEILKAQANDSYNKELLKQPKELLKEFKTNSNLIFDTFDIDSSPVKATEEEEKAFKKVKDNDAKLKELDKREVAFLKGKFKTLTDEELINIINRKPTTQEENILLNRFNTIKAQRESIKDQLRELQKAGLTELEALKVWSLNTTTEINTIITARKIITYNEIYKTDKAQLKNLAYKGLLKERRLVKRQLVTLEYFEAKKIKHGDWITKTIYRDLITTYSSIGIKLYIENLKIINDTTSEKQAKEKALNKLIGDINKYLGLIFKTTINIKNNKEYVKFSSIRLDIDDLI